MDQSKISFKRFLRENRRNSLVIADLSFCVFPSYFTMNRMFESIKSRSLRKGKDFLILFNEEKTVKLARKILPKFGRNILYLNLQENFLNVFHEIYHKRQYRSIDLLFESDLYARLIENNGNPANDDLFFLFEEINMDSAKKSSTVKPIKNYKDSIIDEQIRIHEIVKEDTQIDKYFIERVVNPDLITQSIQLYNEYRTLVELEPIDKSTLIQRPDINIKPISEKRESYVSGNLFSIGDNVKIKGDLSNKEYIVEYLGPNYVSLRKKYSRKNKKRLIKKWINDVSKS